MKKWVALLCVALLASTIVGCSSQGTGKTTSTAAEEDVTLELWTGWQPDLPMYEVFSKGIELFETQNPGIKVQHVTVSWDDIIKKATVASAAADVPNAVWGWDPVDYAKASTDLTEWIENDTSFDKSDILDVAWEYVTVDEKIAAIPAVLEPRVMLYSEKFLKESGIENPPTTVEEVEADIEKTMKLKNNGDIEKLGYWPGMEAVLWGEGQSMSYYAWPLLFGADWFDEDSGTFTINTPETIEALTWIRDMAKKQGTEAVKKYIASNQDTLANIDSGVGPYYNGEVLFWINAPWMLRMNTYDKNIDVKVSAPPATEKGSHLMGGCTWWTPKGVKNETETWKFLKFLSGKEWQELYYSGDPLVPTNKEALMSCAALEGSEWLQSLVDEDFFDKGATPPRKSEFNIVGQEFFDNADDIYYSDKPLGEILQKIEDNANSKLG